MPGTCDAEDTLVTQKHAFLRYWRDSSNWRNAKTAIFALLACPYVAFLVDAMAWGLCHQYVDAGTGYFPVNAPSNKMVPDVASPMRNTKG